MKTLISETTRKEREDYIEGKREFQDPAREFNQKK